MSPVATTSHQAEVASDLLPGSFSVQVSAENTSRSQGIRIFGSSGIEVDSLLSRPYDGEVPFGCAGDRVWAISPQGWGFSSGVNLIHLQMDINAFDLKVVCGGTEVQVKEATYFPSHVHMPGDSSDFQVSGDKWITPQDQLITRLTVRNASEVDLPFEISMTSGQDLVAREFAGEFEMGGNLLLNSLATGWDGENQGNHFSGELGAGESRTFYFVCAFGQGEEEARQGLNALFQGGDALKRHVEEYQSWFDFNTAHFACSDPLVSKMYWHRWYLLRKCAINPRLGVMQHRTFCEGRWKSPWYPYTISYGAPHQIRECRWLRDASYVWGHIQTWTENIRPDGIFPGRIAPEGQLGWQYAEWITSTVWDAYRVKPDRELLSRTAPVLARNALAWNEVYGWDGSPLLVVDDHFWSGMEWQPSFFSFRGHSTEGGESERGEGDPLRRVDLTAFNYGNAMAAAQMMRELGRDSDASRLQDLADATWSALLKVMWNPETKWFHSLRASDGAISPDKEVIGLYPFYFDLPPINEGFEAIWDVAFDPDIFWTKHPLASVALDSPAYSQDEWPVGQGGSICMWNGPSWPHANSIVLTAMANTLRRYVDCAVTKEKMFDLFMDFTRLQYKDGDSQLPWTGEFYNGDTGEWKTEERDYLHSTWIDPLISDLIGLVARQDEILEIDPLLPENAWKFWVLDGQQYRGHDITIAFDEEGGRLAADFRGFAVYLDGEVIFQAEQPTHVLYDMQARQLIEN